MRDCFLFQTRPAPGASRGRRAAFWGWNLGLLLLSAVGLSVLSLMLASGAYSPELVRGCFTTPVLFLLNTLPCAVLLFLLYGLTGRAGWSFLLTALAVMGLSVGNYYKLSFRDDPLMFADLLLLREAGNMAGKYDLFPGKRLLLAAGGAVLIALFLFLFVRARPGAAARLLTAVLALAAGAGTGWACLNDSIYNGPAANYEYIPERWSSTQQYIAHGVLYPFLHSISDGVDLPPEGYSRAEARALLAEYADADIPEDRKVNVVGIMLEAYNDFSRMGVPEVTEDVYLVWHRLEEEGYSGNLVTNIFAGGTVDTERCFLTGCSTLPNFRGRTNSYVWYLREQGYTVEGMHPCHQWFYNRANVNEALGFQRYLFTEGYFEWLADTETAPDAILFPALMDAYRQGTAGGTPYFNFTVTYQGHGPYSDQQCWWGEPEDFVVNNGSFTPEQMNIMANYFGSITNTNKWLKELTDFFRADDKPVVLVLFGDHNPWLGDGNSVYKAMGANFALDTQEGFLNYYATRYIIWANDAAKEALDCDFRGEGPDLGPYFLMNELFRLCGWEGPAFMQAASETMEQVPVLHATGRFMENGEVTGRLSQTGAALAKKYLWLQYDWRTSFAYG